MKAFKPNITKEAPVATDNLFPAESTETGWPSQRVVKPQRDQSLDALRGFAILTMVLSSSIAFGILPAWMYHAQEPPPSHQYIPTLPGISWVDLVFPFFLFSMGAAIPLALNKAIKQGKGFLSILYIAGRRFLLLTYFALFTLHMRPGFLAATPATVDYLLSISAFVLLFFQLYQPSESRFRTYFQIAKLIAFLVAAGLLYSLPFKDGNGFSFYNSDIIILLLGNMAFFGTLIWWFTRNRPWYRMALLPFVMAVFLGSKEAGSWNEAVFNWSPLPWMYKFYYLKYLFIIIPGTWAGEWLQQEAKQKKPAAAHTGLLKGIAALSFTIVIAGVVLLFSRHVVANFLVSTLLCGLLYYFINKTDKGSYHALHCFVETGIYLLLLGLFFEAYEGGVKKDPSTYSYYFITSGFAFFMLVGLYGCQLTKAGSGVVGFLSLAGRNPMVAYVTGNLLLIPLLNLTGGMAVFNGMGNNVWLGLLRGVLFTGIVALIAVCFTRKGWYWKT